MVRKYMLLPLLLMGACASENTKFNISDLKAPSKDAAQLVLYRPYSIMFMRTPDVSVGNKKCTLGINDYALIVLQAGMNTLTSESWDGGKAKLSMRLEAAKRYYVRVDSEEPETQLLTDVVIQSSSTEDWFQLDVVPEEFAQKEMVGASKVECASTQRHVQ